MNDSLTEFLTTFPIDSPLLWALLVMAVVAGASMALFLFWETLLRLRFPFWSSPTRYRPSGSQASGSQNDDQQGGQC